jgi:hypothetical protein
MIRDRLIIPAKYAAVKIAGLFLLSDILHNAGAPIKHASSYRYKSETFYIRFSFTGVVLFNEFFFLILLFILGFFRGCIRSLIQEVLPAVVHNVSTLFHTTSGRMSSFNVRNLLLFLFCSCAI